MFLPLVFPAAFAGGTLVALEVLGDFGVASHFGLNTFTTAIFGAWFRMSDMNLAAKLSLILLLGVLLLSLSNRWAQRNRKYQIVSSKERPLAARTTSSIRGLFLCGACSLVLLLAVVVPLLQLLYCLKLSFSPDVLAYLWSKTATTLQVGFYGTLLIKGGRSL